MSPIPSLQRTRSDLRDKLTSKALISAGFACPFLVPSFFLIRRIHRYSSLIPRTASSLRPTATSGKIWKRRAPAHQGITHNIDWRATHAAGIGQSNRQFSTTFISLAPSSHGPARSRPTKSSSKPASRPAYKPASKSASRPATTSDPRLSRTNKDRSTTYPQKNRPVKELPPKPSKTTSRQKPSAIHSIPKITFGQTVSSDPSPSAPRPQPKWVKAGIPRTKPKANGRAARRAAKKGKGTPKEIVFGDNIPAQKVAEDTDQHDRKEEPATITKDSDWVDDWVDEVRETRLEVKQGKERKQKLSTDNTKKNGSKRQAIPPDIPEPNENPLQGFGSRLAVRGKQVEVLLGRGRRVRGSNTVIQGGPSERRNFCSSRVIRKDAHETQSVGDVGEVSPSTLVGQNATPREEGSLKAPLDEVKRQQHRRIRKTWTDVIISSFA